MAFRRDKVSAEAFLFALACEFPGLFIEFDPGEPHDIILDVSGADLVQWITENRQELKTGLLANLRREAMLSTKERKA